MAVTGHRASGVGPRALRHDRGVSPQPRWPCLGPILFESGRGIRALRASSARGMQDASAVPSSRPLGETSGVRRRPGRRQPRRGSWVGRSRLRAACGTRARPRRASGAERSRVEHTVISCLWPPNAGGVRRHRVAASAHAAACARPPRRTAAGRVRRTRRVMSHVCAACPPAAGRGGPPTWIRSGRGGHARGRSRTGSRAAAAAAALA